ncbi:hypothetical protein [Streptomyces sp. NPDC085479]|uniref:hypothetical protein n=1 Tax=Streptomyces sp. NPDC085479 TaxID=3365726 RepID=UPI0037CDB03B
MNRKIRNAVLAPLAASSLLIGSVAFSTSAAQAAPSATCSVKPSATGGTVDVSGKGFRPGKAYLIEGGGQTSTGTANAKGEISSTGFFKPGQEITALQAGTPETKCGTVEEAEQKDAQEQYRMGYRQGVSDTREDCKKKEPKPGVAQIDPNYEKGYIAGSAAALASAFCK